MSRADTPLLDRAKKIPVPEMGEVIKIDSIELWCTWMKLNNLKFSRWHVNLMIVEPDVKPSSAALEQSKEKGS